MPSMRAILVFAVAALSAPCWAEVCPQIEYAEAKEWTNQQLEEAVCRDYKSTLEVHNAQYRDMLRARDVFAVMNAYAPETTRCDRQMALYERILKSRGQPSPLCGKVVQPQPKQ